MLKWRRESIYIPHENRYVDAIVQKEEVILECELFSDLVIEKLIYEHNKAVSETYQRGLTEGAEIARDVYKGGR